MKNLSVLFAALCLVSVFACGETEEAVDRGPDLLDPASETVVTETTDAVSDEFSLEEIDETVTEPAVGTSTAAQPTPSVTPPTREAADTRPPAAQPRSTPEPAAPARTPEPASQPAPQPETRAPAPAPTPAPAPAQTSSKLPKTHTVDKDGVMHAPGGENAVAKCGACHGKDLAGGRAGVSCLDCHENTWD